jgi:hypothetical protein
MVLLSSSIPFLMLLSVSLSSFIFSFLLVLADFLFVFFASLPDDESFEFLSSIGIDFEFFWVALLDVFERPGEALATLSFIPGVVEVLSGESELVFESFAFAVELMFEFLFAAAPPQAAAIAAAHKINTVKSRIVKLPIYRSIFSQRLPLTLV